MKAIGFRAEPSALNWAVVDNSTTPPTVIDVDVLTAPTVYDEPAALKWFRDNVNLLIDTYMPQVAAVRSPETHIRFPQLATLYQRSRLEGVIVESAHSRGINVVIGPLGTISKNLGTKSAKKYLEQDDLRGLDWRKHKGNRREAILVATSALPQ